MTRHAIVIRSTPSAAYACLKTADLNASPLVRTLFTLRGLPRILGTRRGVREPVTLATLAHSGFVLLAERPGDEIVFGLIGKPWTPSAGLRRVSPDEFVSFAEPGYAKMAWNFAVNGRDDHVGLSTETRVHCLDRASRIRFRFSWAVVKPFSRFIRGEMLRSVRDCAERA